MKQLCLCVCVCVRVCAHLDCLEVLIQQNFVLGSGPALPQPARAICRNWEFSHR